MGGALCALGQGITSILDDKENIPKATKENLLSSFGDAARMLCSLHYQISQLRKELICPCVNPDIKDVLEKSKIDKELFGEDLEERIKAGQALVKTDKEVKKPSQNFKSSEPKKPLNRFRPDRRRETNPKRGRVPHLRELPREVHRRKYRK